MRRLTVDTTGSPVSSPNPYLLPEDLIYGCAFFQHVFCHDFGPLFLHVEHESVQRLLYVTHGVFVAATAAVVVIIVVAGRTVGTSVVITTTVVIIIVGIVVAVLMILVHMIQSIVVDGDDLGFAVGGRRRA